MLPGRNDLKSLTCDSRCSIVPDVVVCGLAVGGMVSLLSWPRLRLRFHSRERKLECTRPHAAGSRPDTEDDVEMESGRKGRKKMKDGSSLDLRLDIEHGHGHGHGPLKAKDMDLLLDALKRRVLPLVV